MRFSVSQVSIRPLGLVYDVKFNQHIGFMLAHPKSVYSPLKFPSTLQDNQRPSCQSKEFQTPSTVNETCEKGNYYHSRALKTFDCQ